MLQLDSVRKSFNRGTADEMTLFDAFSLSVDDGEFVSVIGSNGSGKTTLLNLICGSDSADEGKILFDGIDMTKMKEYRRAAWIGRVFQDPGAGTCPSLTVLENMALADRKGKRYGLGRCVDKRKVERYRERLSVCGMGLENKLNIPVGLLSGGQRQALTLVIADMSDLKLLILDEHTAALDPRSSDTIMALTDRMVRSRGITTLMVTHNLRYAIEYGSRLLMMNEGKIILDLSGEEKKAARVDDLLDLFNRISIEKGN